MTKKYRPWFGIILAAMLIIVYMAFFGSGLPGSEDVPAIRGANFMRFGIDIRGGVDVVFQPKELNRSPTIDELNNARAIIETRLDSQNILDRDITVDSAAGQIFVRYPWRSEEREFNPQKAIQELGDMAHLTFRDPDGNVVLDGVDIQNSFAGPYQGQEAQLTGTYVVNLVMTPAGTQKFADATAALIGKKISIYMDEMLLSDPTVNTAITGGEAYITGMNTSADAKYLADRIKAGALPFALETYSYSTISPTLGAGALNVMIWAGLLAYILIIIFTIIRYRLLGVVAAIALTIQVTGALFILSAAQLTVTLPGLAGIILSVGMGIDCNIIIMERIREELRADRSLDGAVSSGYSRAFHAVFDGNITVLIVAVSLCVFGSGTMLSFGYTLLIGILLNFVAGVGATRMMNMSLLTFESLRSRALYIPEKAPRGMTTFSFIKRRNVFFLVSFAVMLAGIIGWVVSPLQLDIEFKGGAILKYRYTGELNISEVEQIISSELGRGVTAQTTVDLAMDETRVVLSFAGTEGMSPSEMDALENIMNSEFPDNDFALSSSSIVEPFLGQRFLRNGLYAVVLSSILIVIYVWYRFRKIGGLSAGVMALVALLHDLLMVTFAFVLFRIPVGSTYVAVILTILGYSVNDTIVIYDRIRENRRLSPKEDLAHLVDRSVRQSFTRTLITSLTTLASLFCVYGFAFSFGIDSIKSFALPLAIGTAFGCYSSMSIAGPLWVMWRGRGKKKDRRAA